jgi:hypothetical protein
MVGRIPSRSWISVETPDHQKEVVIAKGMNDSQFHGNPLVTPQHNYQLPPMDRLLWRKVVRDGDLRGVKAKRLRCYGGRNGVNFCTMTCWQTAQ